MRLERDTSALVLTCGRREGRQRY